MQGLNTLWKIAIYCRNERVRDLSRDSLCDVFLLFKCKAQKDRIKVQDQFLKLCIKYLDAALEEKTPESQDVIINCLKLFKTYLFRFDKGHIAI